MQIELRPVSRNSLHQDSNYFPKSGPSYLAFRFVPLEEPVNAILICEVSVDPKRHIPQIIEELFACSDGELVKNCSQLVMLSAGNIKGDSITLLRGLRG